MSLTFNESVKLDNTWTKEDWRIEITGPMTPYTVNWEFLSANNLMVPLENLSVWFEYEIVTTQLFGNGSETLTIYFDDLQVMNSFSYGFGMINSTVDYRLFPQESDEECGIFSFMVAIMCISGGIVLIGLVGLLIKHSMVIPWQVINILQFVHFVQFMKLDLPS